MVEAAEDIVRLDMSSAKRASDVLSRAFQEDPVFSYFIPDPETRRAKSRYIMEMLVRYSIKHGEVYATPGFECVSAVLPYDKVEMDFWNGLRNGGMANIMHTGIASIIRQVRTTDLMCDIHKELAPYPHIYGYLIGVEPTLKDQGYGSKMIRYELAKADSQTLPFYCDNVNEENIPKYEHYDMKVIKEYTIPKTQVKIWAMIRNPG